MARATRYELAFNWATTRENPFTAELARAAKKRRLQYLCILRKDFERIRRRVEQGRLRVGMFLNTQADGTSLESPAMLLCRALKASGCMVVEDPDDARVYANRALQIQYIQRAGLALPTCCVVEDWKPGKRVLTSRQQLQLGRPWVAVPGVGLGRTRAVTSSAGHISQTLARSGYKPGETVILRKFYKPVSVGDRELRFRMWYLFGMVVPCWHRRDTGRYELISADDLELDFLARLVENVGRIAGITRLDWFVSELIVTNLRGRRVPMIIEPADALAGLGPGVRSLAEVPAEVLRIAADRLVEVAWRRARGAPLLDGTTLVLD